MSPYLKELGTLEPAPYSEFLPFKRTLLSRTDQSRLSRLLRAGQITARVSTGYCVLDVRAYFKRFRLRRPFESKIFDPNYYIV